MATFNIALKLKTTCDIDTALTLHPFREDDVKIGNLKDEAKIQEKIQAAKDSHLDTVKDSSKLSGTTAKICAASLCIYSSELGVETCTVLLDDHGEKKLIEDIFNSITDLVDGHNEVHIVTWNGSYFDIPMLYQRALVNKIKIPEILPCMKFLNTFHADKYEVKLIDLGKIWNVNKAAAGTTDKLLQVAYAFGITNDYQTCKNPNYNFEEHYSFNNAKFDELIKDIESEADYNKAKDWLTAEIYFIRNLHTRILGE